MRTILHSDLNNFYASVECLRNPEIREKPVIVVGSKEDRHGIVLAKNMIAKQAGVKTGDVYWEAKQKCGKNLVEVQADFVAYLQVSRAVRKIYEDYTDRIEAYGIDECWLDVTASGIFGSGDQIAETIRQRVKNELGLTVSIGVSWNKIFAKLGSDMKKPDAVTVITKENYKDKVWKLPVEELLYVGKATKRKLNRIGVMTIGDLARSSEKVLTGLLGKWGEYLYAFANGEDQSQVVPVGEEENVKSIGNSLTVYRDLKDDEDVKMVIYLLADSIAARMRESGMNKARTVHIYARGRICPATTSRARRRGRPAIFMKSGSWRLSCSKKSIPGRLKCAGWAYLYPISTSGQTSWICLIILEKTRNSKGWMRQSTSCGKGTATI